MKDLGSLLFKVNIPKTNPQAGQVLVAEPFLNDDCFNHGVMALIDYVPEEGATGVVLNNRTEYFLADLLDGVAPGIKLPVFCGGPTGQDRLFFIHTLGENIIPEAREFAPGLYVGGSFDAALEYVNSGYETEGYIRFFIGYSNWVEGQLEREVMASTWANMPFRPTGEQLLTGAGDSYWHRMVRAMGGEFRRWSVLPRNATCN